MTDFDVIEAGATAQVDLKAALAYRDFMVSIYSDAGQGRWLASHGIALLRGTGRLTGPGAAEVDGVRHTADHVVVATGRPRHPAIRRLVARRLRPGQRLAAKTRAQCLIKPWAARSRLLHPGARILTPSDGVFPGPTVRGRLLLRW